VHPAWRDERKRHRLNEEGVRGRLKDPTYFRLSPYEADDKERFTRPDGAVKSAHKWIVDSNIPLLYLSGQSGVGKSSLLNAAIAPALANSGWVVVSVRPHDDPFDAISVGLLKPSAVWQKPPSGNVGDPRDLLERAADRIQKQEKRLLLIIDQFEETLILCNGTVRAELARFLVDLVQRPIDGVVVVLALRAEYLNDLADLGLPAPSYGRNAFEVRPFTRAAAQAFIEASKLDPGAGLLDKVLQEAAEIEDMPDKVRPIVLNMFGLVIASFKGSLPKGVEPGRLLSGYVERSLNNPAVRGVAVEILRPLVTDVATKRALPIDRIAEAARVPRMIARGCLIALANDGLVRPLDKGGDRWEVAHDFVGRLLQPIVRNWRKSAWESARAWLAPAALSVWLVAAVATIFVFPSLHDDFILRDLRTVGLVPGAPNDQGSATFSQNGRPIEDQPKFWRVASRVGDLGYPVAGLLINNPDLTTLDGMPALPALTDLDLSRAGLTSLQGMPALPALTDLDLSSTGLTSLQGMPALPELKLIDITELKLDGFDQLKSSPKLEKILVRRGQIDRSAVPEELRGLVVIDAHVVPPARHQGDAIR